jgi:5-methylcytosine-specific restriction endonuclease McrA
MGEKKRVYRDGSDISTARILRILDRDYWHCAYCGGRATEVDHVIPFTYCRDDSDTNLVAACKLCNSLASDRVFDTIEDKRKFVLARRAARRVSYRSPQQLIGRPACTCADCGKPFQPNVGRATNLLCSQCLIRDHSKGRRYIPPQ